MIWNHDALPGGEAVGLPLPHSYSSILGLELNLMPLYEDDLIVPILNLTK